MVQLNVINDIDCNVDHVSEENPKDHSVQKMKDLLEIVFPHNVERMYTTLDKVHRKFQLMYTIER